MPFDWHEYYTLATELAERPEEAAQRAAISRAYYAAFCSAQKRLRERDPGFSNDPDTGSHYEVWRWYLRHPSAVCKKIGQEGIRLKDERRVADYEEEFPSLPQRTARALFQADRILQRLKNV